MDAESDDFPNGFFGGSDWAEVERKLRLFTPIGGSASWLGLTHRPDDGLTKRQRYNRSNKGKAMNRAAQRKNLKAVWQKCKGNPEYRARKAAQARRRRAALRVAR